MQIRQPGPKPYANGQKFIARKRNTSKLCFLGENNFCNFVSFSHVKYRLDNNAESSLSKARKISAQTPVKTMKL